MSKSEDILRLERDINEQPELQEKLEAEIRRIVETGEAQSDGEAMSKAAASLGYHITLEELERAAADLEKLDDDELDAAGGKLSLTEDSITDKQKKRKEKCGHFHHASDREDEYKHDGACFTAWHCSIVTLHTETKSKDVYCWSDYACSSIKHKD